MSYSPQITVYFLAHSVFHPGERFRSIRQVAAQSTLEHNFERLILYLASPTQTLSYASVRVCSGLVL